MVTAHDTDTKKRIDFGNAEADTIAEVAREVGWRIAAHDLMRSLNHRAYRLAVDEYGGQIRFLLPLTASSRVLQLRSGWGAVTLNVASCAGEVVAVDDRPSRLRFLGSRIDPASGSRIRMVYLETISSLPFADAEFDAVILLDALEHMTGSEAQIGLLRQVMRVLRPGGSLLLAAPNRYGFPRNERQTNEDVQEHGQKRQGHEGGKLRPLGYQGYERLLALAGFSGIEFYASLPSHREPFFILPLRSTRLLTHFVDWMFGAQDYRSKLQERGLGAAYALAHTLWWLGRRTNLVGLIRYLVPSYLILAGKQ